MLPRGSQPTRPNPAPATWDALHACRRRVTPGHAKPARGRQQAVDMPGAVRPHRCQVAANAPWQNGRHRARVPGCTRRPSRHETDTRTLDTSGLLRVPFPHSALRFHWLGHRLVATCVLRVPPDVLLLCGSSHGKDAGRDSRTAKATCGFAGNAGWLTRRHPSHTGGGRWSARFAVAPVLPLVPLQVVPATGQPGRVRRVRGVVWAAAASALRAAASRPAHPWAVRSRAAARAA